MWTAWTALGLLLPQKEHFRLSRTYFKLLDVMQAAGQTRDNIWELGKVPLNQPETLVASQMSTVLSFGR